MKQNEEISSVVRTQLIPLTDMQLVLPNTCIAEVISLQSIKNIKDSPDWLLGMTHWRGIEIPVISYEKTNGLPTVEHSKHTRIAVLNSLEGNEQIPFYGIITQGIPKLQSLTMADINSIKNPDTKMPVALQQTTIHDVNAIIPDQPKIEKLLTSAIKSH
ncbi:MAG: chemotaxis protein CheW [Ectothiorhodospiraceae bacterium]|nr:chemotaxis protein CheW [Ectothiorhodospiraceae bacterium]